MTAMTSTPTRPATLVALLALVSVVLFGAALVAEVPLWATLTLAVLGVAAGVKAVMLAASAKGVAS